LTTDTRTATEYGVVRTYANIQFDFLQDRESIAGGYTEVDYAFIQFAGFTFGKAVSQFDPQWALAKPYISSGFNAGSNNATGIPQLAYTASFGNGVSGTISIENASAYRNAGLWNTNTFIVGPGASTFTGAFYGTTSNTFLGNAYGGNHIPDIVGNIRLDQAWGTLHFGAAMHTATPTFYGANEATGHADDKYGFAVNGAVEFKNLPTGAGDSLKIEATYGKGAAKYVFGGTTDTSGGGRYAKVDGNTIGFGYVLDGVYTTNGQIIQSEAWEVALLRALLEPGLAHVAVRQLQPASRTADGNALMIAAFQGLTTVARAPTRRHSISRWHLRRHRQLRLRPGPDRYPYRLDPGQEPDPVGSVHLQPPRAEPQRHLHRDEHVRQAGWYGPQHEQPEPLQRFGADPALLLISTASRQSLSETKTPGRKLPGVFACVIDRCAKA
jgi:hypothetical protein